jgi:hypothetical protein
VNDPGQPEDLSATPQAPPATVRRGTTLVYLYFGLGTLLGIGELIRVLNRAYIASSGFGNIDIATPLRAGLLFSISGVLCLVLAALAYRGHNGARIGLTVVIVGYVVVGVTVVDRGPPESSAISLLFSIVYLSVVLAMYWRRGADNWYRAHRASSA